VLAGSFVLFDAMDCRDVITESHFKEACILFQSMVRDGVLPDDVSYATALQASACMLSWALGASIHASVIKTGFLDSDSIASSLITMYSKCSSLASLRTTSHLLVFSLPVATTDLLSKDASTSI
jgi:hypothetical protein